MTDGELPFKEYTKGQLDNMSAQYKLFWLRLNRIRIICLVIVVISCFLSSVGFFSSLVLFAFNKIGLGVTGMFTLGFMILVVVELCLLYFIMVMPDE